MAYGGYIVFRKRYDLLRNPGFWFLAIFAVFVFSLRQYIAYTLSYEGFHFGQFPRFTNRIIGDVLKMAAAMLPITVYWLWDRKHNKSPYGFTIKNFNLRPYFLILLVMLPFVVGFGLTDHFTGYYPRGLKKLGLLFWVLGVDPPQSSLLFYELIYGLDFVSIEYFFRGFLVLAFLKYVGPGSILPMAAFYVSIHFGKPMVETISSFFGGGLLGILAFYSRSIWGGIVVHMGIAWLMELGAVCWKGQQLEFFKILDFRLERKTIMQLYFYDFAIHGYFSAAGRPLEFLTLNPSACLQLFSKIRRVTSEKLEDPKCW